jgi:class 3 adenylate cyclase
VKQRHTILVVDDELAVAESVRDLLRLEYRVLCAARGAEGIEILQREEVHVVMTDQRMPEMSGVDFLHRIRGEHPEAIRLLFTGYADMRAVIEAINQGNVFRYIAKPWDPAELMTIIREAVQRYEMAAGLKERVFFESALRRYLAAPVVEQLIRDPARLRLGGEKRDVTVLFFDVVNFTSLSEALPVEDLVQVVNAYLDNLVDAIFRNNGTLDKFIGDAVMAFWGAPLPSDDQARRACNAAVEMQRAMNAFAAVQTDSRLRALRGRIGLNTGVAVLGNLGSSSIMSYTAMGDTVNVASRIESVNKLYGTEICAAGETVERAGWPNKRELDLVRVKGRTKPVTLFELWGLDEAGPPAPARAAYAEGLAYYRDRRFAEAQTAFVRAASLGDHACAHVMARRASELMATPLLPEWDGASTLTGK